MKLLLFVFLIKDLRCDVWLTLEWSQISTVTSMSFYIEKLIVPLGLFEGYANFTMNYKGKFEKASKNKHMKHIGKSPDLHVISVQPNFKHFNKFY